MPTIPITHAKHALFTSKADPEGCLEQCKKIMHEKSLSAEMLLGIDDLSTVTVQEIKKSFQRLALRFHPDKAPHKLYASDAFSILKDASIFLLYKKGALSEDAIKNNIFHVRLTPSDAPTPPIVPESFFEKIFKDLFEHTEGFTEEEIQQLAAMREDIHNIDQADRIHRKLQYELALLSKACDFSCERSSPLVVFKRNELLEKMTTISQPYLEQLKTLDQKMQEHDENHKDRFERSGRASMDLVKCIISNEATVCLIGLKEKESFLQDPYTHFQANWDAIIKKTSELENKAQHDNDYKKAAEKARELVTALCAAQDVFLSSKGPFENNKEKFCEACLHAVDDARDELSHHRGWKQLFADVTINLLIFVGTASLSMVFSGKFRFFKPETDSQKKLIALEDSLHGTIHIPPTWG